MCDTDPMTIVLIVAILYLIAAALLARASLQQPHGGGRGWMWAAVPALLLHAGYHLLVAWRSAGAADLHFFAALSLVGLGMGTLTTCVAVRRRMAALGVVVFPLAAVLLGGYALYGHSPYPGLAWRLLLHASLAVLA